MGFWIVLFVIIGIICYIIDEGSILSKIVLAALVSAPSFLLLKLITGWTIFTTLAKVVGALAVLAFLVSILIAVFGDT